MKHASPTLLVIAALAAAPGAHALSVKDDDVKLGLTLQIQARAEYADASNKNAGPGGTDYAPAEGSNGAPDDLDFYIRRARFGLKGTWKDDYTFALVMRADGAGATSSTKTMDFYEATIGRKFKSADGSIQHGVEFGYMGPHYNTAAGNVHSSSSFLFTNDAITAQGALLAPRNAGIKYHLSAPWISGWVDVQNLTKGSRGDGDSVNAATGWDNAKADQGEGLWTSARIHISPEGEWKMDKAQETWAGKEGKGILVGLDIAQNSNDMSGGDTYSSMGYGIDIVFHMDGLSALAEYRVAENDRDSDTPDSDTNPTSQKSSAWRIQAGYALPMGDTFVEPAIRYSVLDVNEDDDKEGTSFGSKDYGTSGSQLEVGVNWYLHGHANKLQLTYLSWTGEEGATAPNDKEPSADIVRAQWQLAF